MANDLSKLKRLNHLSKLKRSNYLTLFKPLVSYSLLAITLTLTIPLIIWNFTFGLYAGGGFLLTILILLLYKFYKKRKLIYIPTAILIGFVGYMLLLPITVAQINKKQEQYYQKLKQTNQLSTLETWNIYGLHWTMMIVGTTVAPEASYELLLMHFPNSGNITANSDFFLKSTMLNNAMKANSEGHLYWKGKYYALSSPEHRYALALNPTDYKVKRYPTYTVYSTSVPVKWYRGPVTLFKSDIMTIQTEESLFKYLEKQGWLFPYKMTWKHIEYYDNKVKSTKN